MPIASVVTEKIQQGFVKKGEFYQIEHLL